MANLASCPTDAELRDLLLGKSADAIGEHLLDCPQCGANAGRLVASDPLLAELRAAHETSEIGTDGTFVEELLRRIKQPSSTKTLPDAELAFLDPAKAEFPTDLGMFNHYRIVEKIGEGGMGMVFRAHDTNLQRTVALKIILPRYAANQKLRDRFIEEARATVKVRSPHVAEVYETNVWKDVPYLTMELLVGTTLDKKPKPMSADALRRIGYSIAKGLADAHRSGMIHRDLKPSNIHLGTDSRTGKPTVKLIDFGLARPVNREIEITKSGELLGTPAYMSPEQARGKKVDHRTDLYSLGVILHQLATGQLPYEGADAGVMAILTELATPEPLTSVSTRAANLPPALASLIDRLLAKDPANRPASADEVMKVLKASLGAKADPAGGTDVAASAPYVSLSDGMNSLAAADAATEPDTAAPEAEARPKRPWLWPAVGVGAILAAVLIALGLGAFKVKTKDGTVIVLTDLPDDAEVLVDGEVTTVTWDAGKQKAEVTVKPGTRTLQVRKDGFRVTGDEITLAEGERKPFAVTLEKEEVVAKPAAEAVAVAPAITVSDELAVNGGCDLPNYRGWNKEKGTWNPTGGIDPYFRPGKCADAVLSQDIDVGGYAKEIDAGRLDFKFSGLIRCYSKGQADKARIQMFFLDADKKELAAGYDSGFVHESAWKEFGGTRAPKAGTRFVRIVLHSRRDKTPGNEENSGYYDNLSLKALVRKTATAAGRAIATHGKVRQVGEELSIEPENSPGSASVAFGDPAWTDYDFVADVKGNGFLFFRVTDKENFWDYETVPDKPGYTCRMRVKSNGTFTRGPEIFNVLNTKADGWNRMKVSVRGSEAVCYFNDREVGRYADARNPKGHVGLGAFRGEVRFRNVRVTAPDGTKLFEGFPDLAVAPPPRTETRVLGGQWRQAADRLFLARDAAMYFPQVAFGDRNWTEYDFTVQVRRVAPTAHQFGLCFRSNGPENQNTFSLGAFGNTLYQAEENKAAKWNQMQTRKAALKLDAWYTATVKVRGNKFECLLAEGDAPAETIFRGTTSHPRGQVGIVTFKTGGYLFRNIKVTAPNGDLLWDGLPEVEAVDKLPDPLAALNSNPAPPPAPAKPDPFPNGTVWRGVKIIERGDFADLSTFYEMTVDRRTGNDFTGSVWDNGPNRNPAKVTGTVDGNKIEWRESPLNNPTHFTAIAGTHEAGQLVLTTEGTFGNRGNAGRARLFRVRRANEVVPDEFYPIFDGRGLNNWETHPSQKDGWTINQYGKLLGKGNGVGHLYTKREYGDVHVWCRAKLNDGGNGGLFPRSTFGPVRGNFPDGYEAQLACNFPNNQPTGTLFAWGTKYVPSGPDTVKPNEWFTLEAIVRGPTVQVLLNGQETVQFTDPTPRPKAGRIALQLHDAKSEVEFAMVAVKELK